MIEEVRYQCLRPDQIVERIKACPIAYIPLGNLEWHGFHLPMGVDSLLAEKLAILCARFGGGLVMPTLNWGDNRIKGLVDATVKPNEISAAMMWEPDACSRERWLKDEHSQDGLFHDLLLHILNQCENYGFKVATLVCGHRPFIDRAAKACEEYNKGSAKTGKMIAWNTISSFHSKSQHSNLIGGHASFDETSQMLCTYPELVDMSALPDDGSFPLGTFGPKTANDASAGFGEEILQFAAEEIAIVSKKRLPSQS